MRCLRTHLLSRSQRRKGAVTALEPPWTNEPISVDDWPVSHSPGTHYPKPHLQTWASESFGWGKWPTADYRAFLVPCQQIRPQEAPTASCHHKIHHIVHGDEEASCWLALCTTQDCAHSLPFLFDTRPPSTDTDCLDRIKTTPTSPPFLSSNPPARHPFLFLLRDVTDCPATGLEPPVCKPSLAGCTPPTA